MSIVMLFDMTATSQVVLKRLAEGARTALTHLKPGDGSRTICPNVAMRRTDSNDGESRTVHTESEAIRSLHESGTVVAPLLLRGSLAIAWAAPMLAFEAPFRHSHPPGDAHKYAEITDGQAISLGVREWRSGWANDACESGVHRK